jgi:hypothetical protein
MRHVLALLMLVASAQAAMAGVESCEKIKDADAYNNCLASFGPAVGEHRVIRAPEGEDVSRPAHPSVRPKAAAREKTPAARETKVTRKPNGRVRIEILVPSGR